MTVQTFGTAPRTTGPILLVTVSADLNARLRTALRRAQQAQIIPANPKPHPHHSPAPAVFSLHEKPRSATALVFGTSSRLGGKANKRFQARIDELAKKLGEGECFRPQRSFSAKDSKLDLVAWKAFPDARASQIILFGQCAAGANWAAKLNELIPEDFWDQWMNRGKVSAPLRSVFVPHRIFDDDEWEKHARSARLLFDRCRVVAFAHHETARGKFADRLLRCCRTEWKLNV